MLVNMDSAISAFKLIPTLPIAYYILYFNTELIHSIYLLTIIVLIFMVFQFELLIRILKQKL